MGHLCLQPHTRIHDDFLGILGPPEKKAFLGKVIFYTLKQWDRLMRYIEDGFLRPDNSLGNITDEQLPRHAHVSLRLKKRVFSHSPKGTENWDYSPAICNTIPAHFVMMYSAAFLFFRAALCFPSASP